MLPLPVATAVMSALTADTAGGTHDELADEALSTVTGLSWIPLLLVLLLGTIVATSEYERGAIQTTFAVAPRRASVVLAKAALVAVTVLVATLLTPWCPTWSPPRCSAVTSPRPSATRASCASSSAPPCTRPPPASIAMCFGFLTRSSIGAVTATLGFLYVVPAILQAIPIEAVGWFARTIPGPPPPRSSSPATPRATSRSPPR